MFIDKTCSYTAPLGTYEKFSYENARSYADESLIDVDCMLCRVPSKNDSNNNSNNNGNNCNGNNDYHRNYQNNNSDDNVKILEMCERLYKDAGKCEANLANDVIYYPNTDMCKFLQTLKKPGNMGDGGAGEQRSGVTALRVFAGLIVATTVAFVGVVYVLYSKAQRTNVDLTGGRTGVCVV